MVTPRTGLERTAARGRLSAAVAAAVLALLAFGQAVAQDRLVEDVQLSRSGDEAEIAIRLACPMRHQSDVASESAALVEIRLAPFEQCRALGRSGGIYSELHRPVGGRLARLLEIEYESLGIGDSLLTLRFEGPVAYRISQRADLRSLVVVVSHDVVVPVRSALESTAPPPAPPARASRPTEPVVPREGREPLSGRVVEPVVVADYMINLLSQRTPPDPATVRSLSTGAGLRAYVSQIEMDGAVWYRLRLGFFDSESAARAALDPLRAAFPRAWIGRAEAEEVRLAAALAPDTLSSDVLIDVTDEATPPAASEPALESMPAAEVEALLAEARNAMLDDDYPAAAAIYQRLLQVRGEHRETAREFLGLAYERMGDANGARAQYEAYLRDFPESAGRARVEQRLAGVARVEAPSAPLRSASSEGRWEWGTGVSQYYRTQRNTFDDSVGVESTFSALFSDIDFSLSRRGDRVDTSTRLSLSHVYDLDDGNSGGTDHNRVSYAYFDAGSVGGDWSVRLGRQSQYGWGVLGRFDGAHFSYGWTDDRAVHVMLGHPVESTRDSVETDREFQGIAVELDELAGNWDLAAFVNRQTVEGLEARTAVGSELRYFDEKRTFTGMVDYDTSFDELNTVLALGTWRFGRTTLNALYDGRKSPVLSTRNALIGQPVGTVDELLLVWTEDEIRQLALDRTADSRTVTLGVATPLGDRFQINFDATLSEFDGTVASGGVAAIPGTGTQTFYSTSLISTGLLKARDVSILSLRVGDSDTFETSYFSWDMRFPVGRRIRINPRIRYAVWRGLLDGRERETLSPTLAFLMNTRNHYRIELELGASRQTRTDAGGTTDSSGAFLNFGYWASF